MDHQSILDRSSASPAVQGNMPGTGATRSTAASVSAGIAAANAHLPRPVEPVPRFPGESGGRSLAEIAHSDLDAALQLLVERAQYITGASSAAIALRRGQHNDMLCRASVGSNAPELGALLSLEYGLSGESVRTRQAQRCDDAERDPRVNHEGCRELGIASVVVMPIVNDEQVLGVFELFSGEPRAFEERDIFALQRLSEMVETAVKHAVAMQTMPAVEGPIGAESQPSLAPIVIETAPVESAVGMMLPDVVEAPLVTDLPAPEPEKTVREKAEQEKTEAGAKTGTKTETKPEPAPKKPLFWSAAMQTQGGSSRTDEAAASISVPPVLRNLRKCQACGFPVSQGRAFCVECEERQWRGQRLSQPAAKAASGLASAGSIEPASGKVPISVPRLAAVATPQNSTSAPIKAATGPALSPVASAPDMLDPRVHSSGSRDSAPFFFGSDLASESWFAANKYILGALLVVAIVIAAIVWLR
jgi:hypothetical protein